MSSFSTRFIIITVPTGTAFRKLSSMMHLLEHAGETYTAATYPPHVTLRTGAVVPISEVESFILQFQKAIGTWNAFDLETDGVVQEEYIKHGEQRFFVYYRIKESVELNNLNRRLLEFTPYIKSQKKTFQPHLSLAYKDLSAEGFRNIKHLMASKPQMFPPTIQWKCDNISLYHMQHMKWVPYHLFSAADNPKKN